MLGRTLTTLLLAGVLLSCAAHHQKTAHHPTPQHAVPPVAPPTLTDAKPRDYPGLHNVVTYYDNYYSGSVPEGQPGFDTLQGMGIRTVISVDGAAPDVETAHSHGMRYIHLPIGYNGFDDERKLQLIRATRDAMKDGPVYIHCHHGKHRSAGAAASVAASLGWLTPQEAEARMKVSGTAPNYKGLYACATNATIIPAARIDAVSADFPEVSRPTGFRKGMIEVDDANEHLKAIEKAGWKVPQDHPDLVPVAEAGRLSDLLRHMSQSDRAKANAAEFGESLAKGSSLAQTLEESLAAGETDTAKLSAQFKAVAASCTACHVSYRDSVIP